MEAENLCAFRNLSYAPLQGVTTLVFGDNRDNESQRSNGAGKSALLECIAVGITGSPLRKIRSEEIINDAADGCRVRLQFVNEASGEQLTVSRRIPRKGTSEVSCTLLQDGQRVENGGAVQPSVDAYNHYILEKLGITREELLNNFILSKYRYEDFLSSPDAKKKEIINRFSNGILVDEAIARVEEDIAPLAGHRQTVTLELAGLDGRVEMLQEQIRKEEEAGEHRSRSRAERIAGLETAIAGKRDIIRNCNGTITGCEERLKILQQYDTRLQELEAGDSPLEGCLQTVGMVYDLFPDVTPTPWKRVVEEKKEMLHVVENRLDGYDNALRNAREALEEKRRTWEDFQKEYGAFCDRYRQDSAATAEKMKALETLLQELAGRVDGLRRQRRVLASAVDSLANRLAGKIACPSCGHEFLVAEPDFDIEAGRQQLAQKRAHLDELGSRIASTETESEQAEKSRMGLNADRRALETDRDRWEQRLRQMERDVREAGHAVRQAEHEHEHAMVQISSLQDEIGSLRRRMFDEVFGLIDGRNARTEREIRAAKEEIHAAECAIETLQGTIREVNGQTVSDLAASLRASLKEMRARAKDAAARKLQADDQVRALEIQRERFVQFKTYLANTKIEALGHLTNEFLQETGSDIRIRFDGYTVLKSGKVRERISVTLLRDGLECGSFGKFSAGEAARVNLATILAMQKLVNTNCEEGKGLDLLVVDELLDSMDESGLASTFTALNSLGITAFVVSHGNVAEGYPYKLVIVKENGESRIGE